MTDENYPKYRTIDEEQQLSRVMAIAYQVIIKNASLLADFRYIMANYSRPSGSERSRLVKCIKDVCIQEAYSGSYAHSTILSLLVEMIKTRELPEQK